jgi:uncharacterized ferritin-like protein (DUF455 family)
MTEHATPDVDLFTEGPARDERIVVAERWSDCDNLAPDHPLVEVEFFHRQMNEELNGLECSARCLGDFPTADWSLRMSLARQCADEVRHCRMFRRLLECRGGHVGQFPVLNFQYRIINRLDTLIARLTIQNRSFEAGGIDAIAAAIESARERGDNELTELFESQLADEITHVRFANKSIRAAIDENPRTLLEMGAALRTASEGFARVMGPEGVAGATSPAARQARREAGFTDDEVQTADMLADAKRAAVREHPPMGRVDQS